jgi:hypothetical protein
VTPDDRLRTRLAASASRDTRAAAQREAERREDRALAAIARAARALPRPRPGPGFTDRTMARVRRRPPPRRGLRAWLLWPRLAPLGGLAGAAAAGFLAVGMARFPVPAPASPDVAALAAPVVVAHLALAAPSARQVHVAGDFNGWRPEVTPLRRGDDGRWRADVPVSPGRRYEYMFVVDGTWVTDPAARAHADDGFGGANAILDL